MLDENGIVPPGVFRDTAWDMMLELFIAHQQHRLLCVKDLTALSGETAAGAVRRIDRLQAATLVRRRTDRGHDAMAATLQHMAPASN